MSMIGNVIPSIEAGGVEEKRGPLGSIFYLPKFKTNEFFGYSVQTDGYCSASHVTGIFSTTLEKSRRTLYTPN